MLSLQPPASHCGLSIWIPNWFWKSHPPFCPCNHLSPLKCSSSLSWVIKIVFLKDFLPRIHLSSSLRKANPIKFLFCIKLCWLSNTYRRKSERNIGVVEDIWNQTELGPVLSPRFINWLRLDTLLNKSLSLSFFIQKMEIMPSLHSIRMKWEQLLGLSLPVGWLRSGLYVC